MIMSIRPIGCLKCPASELKVICMHKVLALSVFIFLFLCIYESQSADTGVASREILSSEIKGSVVFSKDRYIHKVIIGKWTPIELCRGDYARWSPDGSKIAVYDRRKIYVMDADGSNRKLVCEEAWQGNGCPIEFHANGHEITFTRRKEQGLWAVDIDTGSMRKLLDLEGYAGEVGMSADGNRMVYRLTDLFGIDLTKNISFVYLKKGFSAGISPDGNWLMNNTNNGDGSHEVMNIRSWDGKTVKVLRAGICQPDGEWGHHTWSNHNDYITAQGGLKGETYVIKLSANQGTRITWGGKTVYPDLYVESVASSETLPNLLVETVNKNYSRTKSRIMIRHIANPTRANLDYSAYDSNVMFCNPTMPEHKQIPDQALSELHFGKTIIAESLTDQLSLTPLTPSEISSPMAWKPMTEYLMDRDFDRGYALAEAGWKISEYLWNDDRITEAFQEISRIYIHKSEIWVKIEFKPWVKFLKGIDDEDQDGFPEIYGKLNPQFYDEKVIDYLTNEYAKKVVSDDEITEWGYKLANNNYDKYATQSLKPEQITDWQKDIEPEIKSELGDLTLNNPAVIIRGRPFGEMIYNVFIIR